jgi:hypothetical protein
LFFPGNETRHFSVHLIIFIFFSEAHTHTKKNMSADSITCNMNGSIHTIDYPADATGEGIRRTLAERTGHPFDLIELIHAEGVLADRGVVARGAELTVMIKPAPLLLPGMADTPEFREELYFELLDCGISHTTSDGLRYSIVMGAETDDEDEVLLRYVRAFIVQRMEGLEHSYTSIWGYESSRSNHARVLGDMAYEALCKLISAVRNVRECSRCNKRRRIMKGTEHCMRCLLAPLAEEQ